MLVKNDQTGIISVPWVGAGFLFIPGNLLRKLNKPYFRHEFAGETQTGEDIGFCLSAQRSGIAIYLDGGCRVRHLTQPHHFLEDTMSDVRVSNEVKILIIEKNLKAVNQGVYESTINARVAAKIDDKEMASRAKAELVRLEKLLDAYSEELKDISQDVVKES